jgi:16S rRNA processing protein RimM
VEAAYLAVARFRKPHGLKGEAVLVALTDRPAELFAPGKLLTPLDQDGVPAGPPLTVERGRWYHREQWIVKFDGLTRSALETWRGTLFGVPQTELSPPGPDEMYEHEIPGATVVADGVVIGVADGLAGAPGARVLVVKAGEREHLIPFKPPILVRLDRAARRIEVAPPVGLLDL